METKANSWNGNKNDHSTNDDRSVPLPSLGGCGGKFLELKARRKALLAGIKRAKWKREASRPKTWMATRQAQLNSLDRKIEKAGKQAKVEHAARAVVQKPIGVLVLRTIAAGRTSVAGVAAKCGLIGATGQPQKEKAHRILTQLAKAGMARLSKDGRGYKITAKGRLEISPESQPCVMSED